MPKIDEKHLIGERMDEIESPPLRMILVFLGLTIIGFIYSIIWAFLLTP